MADDAAPLLDERLCALAASYAPTGRPALGVLVRRASRRRHRQVALAGTAVALAAVAVAVPALHHAPADDRLAAAAVAPGADRLYARWLASPASRGLDVRALPRYEVSASWVPPPPTLEQARAGAVRVVAGTVVDLHFAPGGSRLTVRVDRTVKGPAAAQLVVAVDSYPEAAHDGVPAHVTLLENDVLVPGDRAVWLLEDRGGALQVQAFTGQYPVRDGRVTSTPGNPFAAQVDALTEGALLARLAL